ncbi:hypothetical protein EYF80_043613 [Liparis tanakae]|uniref:Uncharacterized protein n=1 Tax=Liparis tanakae TaxID=230148 RepID=A0A4Z2G052_9TELE|nr:hypothetical protein EYF80_043613 [Liparis tanakae]
MLKRVSLQQKPPSDMESTLRKDYTADESEGGDNAAAITTDGSQRQFSTSVTSGGRIHSPDLPSTEEKQKPRSPGDTFEKTKPAAVHDLRKKPPGATLSRHDHTFPLKAAD